MGEYKTPGVYIKEKNAFGSSVVEAETAIPAFVGVTEKAVNGNQSLVGKPWKISSLTEFNAHFGGAPVADYTLCLSAEQKLDVVAPAVKFNLYYQMVMFFANGGSTCYVVSVGDYNRNSPLNKNEVGKALKALEKEQEVTLVVVPEAVYSEDYQSITTDVIQHCGGVMKNRMAILDVQWDKNKNGVENFREIVGNRFLSYAAAYYPWLKTSVVSVNDVNPCSVKLWDFEADAPNLSEALKNNLDLLNYFNNVFNIIKTRSILKDNDSIPLNDDEVAVYKKDLHNALLQNWPEYKYAVKKIKDDMNLLPPSAAMAGIYASVDNARGVWKAPANVSVNYVEALSEDLDDRMQEELNVPMSGKAVNAIRPFPGDGIKVWGARTLDGNSQDWRYVNVRRTMLFLEESVKNAARPYVFEPNDAGTWINIKCMIENFLRNVWKRGGLAGATPEEAYEVHVGLGDTMSAEDILEGMLRISVLVAVTRPAEFIEITFQQQMQKS